MASGSASGSSTVGGVGASTAAAVGSAAGTVYSLVPILDVDGYPILDTDGLTITTVGPLTAVSSTIEANGAASGTSTVSAAAFLTLTGAGAASGAATVSGVGSSTGGGSTVSAVGTANGSSTATGYQSGGQFQGAGSSRRRRVDEDYDLWRHYAEVRHEHALATLKKAPVPVVKKAVRAAEVSPVAAQEIEPLLEPFRDEQDKVDWRKLAADIDTVLQIIRAAEEAEADEEDVEIMLLAA